MVTSLANIFSHSVCCLFTLFIVCFAVQKLLSLIKSYLFKFLFLFPLLSESDEKDFAVFYIIEHSDCFPLSFIVSGLIFRSLIYFEFISVYGVKKIYFILLHVAVQFSQHHLLKRLCFLHCTFLSPLS